jgi:hypothetical protein
MAVMQDGSKKTEKKLCSGIFIPGLLERVIFAPERRGHWRDRRHSV